MIKITGREREILPIRLEIAARILAAICTIDDIATHSVVFCIDKADELINEYNKKIGEYNKNGK